MPADYFIGIDWGTHSSKWSLVSNSGTRVELISSNLFCSPNELILSPKEGDGDRDQVVRRLKGVLIQDPLGQDFWGAQRKDTGTSLGEAIAFSLCSLICASIGRARKDAVDADYGDIELGLSFPNWIADRDRGSLVAAQNFCEAVDVAVRVLSDQRQQELPLPHRSFAKAKWKEMVASVRTAKARSVQELTVEDMTSTLFKADNNGLSWRFLVESGAAGIPYLRAMETEAVPGTPGLAKLLVIDIGAGSTDVGYMLRVMRRDSGKPNFYFFRPATSFPEAGEVLTRSLMHHNMAKGKAMPFAEAEATKIQSTGWHKLAFVQAWIDRISDYVREYMEGVPDERWLPMPVALNVVLTGGSSLVPGLKARIKEGVIEALRARRCKQSVLDKVSVADRYRPRFDFRTEAEIAQRAVCIGAADTDKPGFKYIAKMDAPTRGGFRVGKKGWV